jgi:Rrf2 family protein
MGAKMKLSAKVEYACMATLELTLRYKADTPVQLTEIAGAQEIPEKFLTQIFQRLKAAGIVDSARGMSGGYFLAKDPANITMADVVRAVDSAVLEISGEAEMTGGPRGRDVVLRCWNSVSKSVIEQFEHITFEELVNRLKGEQLTYHI